MATAGMTPRRGRPQKAVAKLLERLDHVTASCDVIATEGPLTPLQRRAVEDIRCSWRFIALHVKHPYLD